MDAPIALKPDDVQAVPFHDGYVVGPVFADRESGLSAMRAVVAMLNEAAAYKTELETVASFLDVLKKR